jgi:hypothetical protein
MTAYMRQLTEEAERAREARDVERAAKNAADTRAAQERLTPLDARLSRLLATIPVDVQRQGLSLTSLQKMLRGRWRGTCHPGELGSALRKLQFSRARCWSSTDGFVALWYPPGAQEQGMSKKHAHE